MLMVIIILWDFYLFKKVHFSFNSTLQVNQSEYVKEVGF